MIRVHVYSTTPAQPIDFTAQGLCKEDQKYWSTIHSESRRNLFLYSRQLLYRVLGEATGLTATTLSIGRGRHGKPHVENAPGFLDFSISHSRDFLAIAVSRCQPVGVDIEDLALRGPAPTLESVCSETELRRHASLPKVNFLEIWTQKEAFLKLNGVGLAVDPKTVEPTRGNLVRYRGDLPLIHQRARVALFNSRPGYVMSLAYPALRGQKVHIELIEEHC